MINKIKGGMRGIMISYTFCSGLEFRENTSIYYILLK